MILFSHWNRPAASCGDTIFLPCPGESAGLISRTCNAGPAWAVADASSCINLALQKLLFASVTDPIASLVALGQITGTSEIFGSLDMISMYFHLQAINEKLKLTTIDAASAALIALPFSSIIENVRFQLLFVVALSYHEIEKLLFYVCIPH